jgi:hypothetical protein
VSGRRASVSARAAIAMGVVLCFGLQGKPFAFGA